jgi:hypothetical protein
MSTASVIDPKKTGRFCSGNPAPVSAQGHADRKQERIHLLRRTGHDSG